MSAKRHTAMASRPNTSSATTSVNHASDFRMAALNESNVLASTRGTTAFKVRVKGAKESKQNSIESKEAAFTVVKKRTYNKAIEKPVLTIRDAHQQPSMA